MGPETHVTGALMSVGGSSPIHGGAWSEKHQEKYGASII